MPKFLIARPLSESEMISMENQKKFWLGVVTLLFLVKHSRLDIAMTRELSKANNGTNSAMLKQLLYVFKYVLNTSNFCLKLEPTRSANESKKMIYFNKSNYVQDLFSSLIVTGSIP